MIFSTALFLFFFVPVALVHWFLIPALPARHRLRAAHLFLLIVSYLFYMNWDWRFGFLIAFSTLVDYVCGLYMGRLDARDGIDTNPDATPAAESTRKRRAALVLSLLTNLGVLAYFKYADFFIGSFVDLINLIAPGTYAANEREGLLLGVLLPLGISFFTFQSMSYTIDVFRRTVPVERSLLRFALFVSFFPQLVAGPIVTAKTFLPQLDALPKFDMDRMRAAGRWFALGFFKKTVLADNMGPIVDQIYATPEAYGAAGHWIGAFGFWVQVYCDFSGYSDMAWGAALFLGYHLPENFRIPYISRSVTEHWQRWHMSLIGWIRDYLYIPLGGNRVGFLRHKFNVFLTMFLAGLWHGANWTFVIWGSIHGTILTAEATWNQWRRTKGAGGPQAEGTPPDRPGVARALIVNWPRAALAICATSFCTVFFGTMFRAPDIGTAFIILGRMLGMDVGRIPETGYLYSDELLRPVVWGSLAVIVGHVLGYYIFEKKSLRPRIPVWAEVAFYPLFIILCAQLGAAGEAFIYFVF